MVSEIEVGQIVEMRDISGATIVSRDGVTRGHKFLY